MSPPAAPPILLLGASVRAAACSARRAGWVTSAIDLFVDQDLPSRWKSRASAYPSDLERLAEQAPAGPWLYTGALENHPDVIERVSGQRELLGNPAGVVRQVRWPWNWQPLAASCGIGLPPMRRTRPANPRGWLWKSYGSSSGLGVQRARAAGEATAHRQKPEDGYWQRAIDGRSSSALFLAAGGRCQLLGVSWQLIGGPGAGPFQYCGSLFPAPLPARQQQALQTFGEQMAAQFGLTGLWGLDFIATSRALHALEINPRYTASTELIEAGLDRPLLADHLHACRRDQMPVDLPTRGAGCPPACGKQLLFATAACRLGAALQDRLLQWNESPCAAGCFLTAAADLPAPGLTFRPGQPICTLFAVGEDPTQVKRRLDALSDACRQQLNS